MRFRKLYSAAGVLLGLGAPLGAIVGKALWVNRGWWLAWWRQEWGFNSYFYIYMTVGCVLVFALFGFFLGRRADAQERESGALSDTFQTLNLLAIKDGLTGLFNHRYLQERLAIEMESADRYKAPLSCLMLDIDDFKSVNDTHGHPFGDSVLTRVARIIRENVRKIDTAGRYGGEEFLILMPQSTAAMSQVVAERIRKAIAAFPFKSQEGSVHVTLSVGIATYPMPGVGADDKTSFLKGVDKALYHAKRGGKNQTFVNP